MLASVCTTRASTMRLIRFDQFERRIDDIEAHVESYDLGGKKGLKDEFSELEAEDAVAQELRELKSKRAGQKRGNDPA